MEANGLLLSQAFIYGSRAVGQMERSIIEGHATVAAGADRTLLENSYKEPEKTYTTVQQNGLLKHRQVIFK